MKQYKTLNDVIKHIKADQAWEYSVGADVHIAIIDTGVCGDMPEFPRWKRSPYAWPSNETAWSDPAGHGSMVACIASAIIEQGGRYNGVAPQATLISCRTTFDETELCHIYEHLINLVERGKIGPLVINNSYGLRKGSSPDIDPHNPFPQMVRTAINKGVVVIFPAGNNHVMRGGNDPFATEPNSIWGVSSFDEVLCVGTVNENNRMDEPPSMGYGFGHWDSSRGPGQFSQQTIKPDCVAPTYGEVMWGKRYVVRECWGTSGAAPQVAGLAALLLSKNPKLTPYQIQEIIKKTCLQLPFPAVCVGAGLIDCQAAVTNTNC
jgi:subtilisin family serine protease